MLMIVRMGDIIYARMLVVMVYSWSMNMNVSMVVCGWRVAKDAIVRSPRARTDRECRQAA
jgi:hypothetical protein